MKTYLLFAAFLYTSITRAEDADLPAPVRIETWGSEHIHPALCISKKGTLVGVFAFSTFDTHYLLVKEVDFPKIVAVLRAAGHVVEEERA